MADNYDEGSEDNVMNISQLKAFFSEKPEHLGGKDSIQNQLRDSGLRQAIDAQSNFASLKADKFSSSATLGVKVFSNALNTTLEVNHQKPDFSKKPSKEVEKSMFDFEEVAKNVLNFVGGAIKNAQNKGAGADELKGLFEQATSGVLRGIKLAEKDLAGFMNEDIKKGITSSKNLIDQGIEKLRQQIFNPEAAEQNGTQNTTVTNNTEVSYGKLEMGELTIRTQDGDQVNIRFEDLQAFEASQQQIQQASAQPVAAQQQAEVEELAAEPAQAKVAARPADVKGTTHEPDPESPAEQERTEQSASASAVSPENTEQAQQNSEVEEPSIKQNAIFYQQQSLSFSVKGELDEDELKAISDLVSDANDLADEFFNGDIETAFNQALELGFNEQELTGFALQLNRVESAQVIKAYESVSHYDEDNQGNEDATKSVKPVADYMDKLLDVLDRSSKQLENSQSYENMVAELINRLGEVATPDLITAINRFNGFNQKLVDNLPIGFQLQA